MPLACSQLKAGCIWLRSLICSPAGLSVGPCSLKYELVYHHRFATLAQARSAIFHYIETFYNRTRLHSSLDYQTPTHFESKQT